MDRIDFVKELRIATQSILDRTFMERAKKRIKVKYSSLNFACPYCMDSASDQTKKRGNLIIAGDCSGFYKCFNCGHYTSAKRFFKDFNRPISKELSDELTELEESFNEDRKPNKSNLDLSIFAPKPKRIQRKIDLSLVDLIYDYELVDKYAVDKHTLYNHNSKFKIIPVTESQVALDYLKSRNQYFEVNFPKFGYIPEINALAIFNLTSDEKVIGFQTRFLDANVKNRFRTYKTSRIHNDLLCNTKIKVPNNIDKISTMFNIMLVDFNRPIICLEGPMDSMLIPNSIATSSASINPPDILEPYYYMYDSDKAGNDVAINKLNKGENVFLWSKFKEDFKLPIRNKWDWNDVQTYLKENNMQPPKDLLVYFSNNPLDVVLI